MSLYLLMLALLHYSDVNVLLYKYDFSAIIAGLNKLISSQIYKSSLLIFILLFFKLFDFSTI